MATKQAAAPVAGETRNRTFRVVSYRGLDLSKLLDLDETSLKTIFRCRQRRKFDRGINASTKRFLRKLVEAKKGLEHGEKPKAVRTHYRDLVIVPEMIGSVVAVYNGQRYISVEIKPEMIGYYLGEFALSYQMVQHGRAGAGSTQSSRFIPLK